MAVKTYTEYLEEILKNQNKLQKEELENKDTEYNTLKQQVKSQYANDISLVQETYDDYIDKSYVQKLIDKKQVQETMANMGLTDSGLNRTQQTAVELSHSNRAGNYNALKQQKIDALRQAMRSKITDLQIENQQSKQSIKEKYYKDALSKATELYKQQESNQSESAKKKEKAWESLVKTLFNDDITVKERNFALEQYYQSYGFSENEKYLLDKANVNYSFIGKNQNGNENQGGQATTEPAYNISDSRKTELKDMCDKGLMSVEVFANELRLNNYKGTYKSYCKKVFERWLIDGEISETEYDYLLDEFNIE